MKRSLAILGAVPALAVVLLPALLGCRPRTPPGASDAGARRDAAIADAATADTAALDAAPPRDRITSDCRMWSERRGEMVALHGDVQFVDSFADFEIEEVSSFSDLDVQMVTAFPDDCGEWHEVTAFPDFTVQVVDSFGDFEIRYVTSFPGLP